MAKGDPVANTNVTPMYGAGSQAPSGIMGFRNFQDQNPQASIFKYILERANNPGAQQQMGNMQQNFMPNNPVAFDGIHPGILAGLNTANLARNAATSGYNPLANPFLMMPRMGMMGGMQNPGGQTMPDNAGMKYGMPDESNQARGINPGLRPAVQKTRSVREL